ncbi:MAG: PocR ligand-binding domain-containing protein [Proteobacteria bacterium]|nr:PocR ligand-binding domain-containing protein [Pseudomonadota bacterium]
MKHQLADLVELDKVKAVLESFYRATGIPPSITDTEGQVLIGIGWQNICTKFHRVHPDTLKRCHTSDTFMAQKLDAKTGYARYRCLNGLVDMAVPIFIDGQHLANLFTGQFFLEPPDLESFRKQAHQFGFDETAYLDAVAQVPIFTEEQTERAILFLADLSVLLGEMGLNNKRLLTLNEQLEQRVRARTAELEEEMDRRKAIQQQLLEASKLEGVLEMAGSTAHEFSQPLQVILGETEYLNSRKNDSDPDYSASLEALLDGIGDLAELIRKVQGITRYSSTSYTGRTRILDLDGSSD